MLSTNMVLFQLFLMFSFFYFIFTPIMNYIFTPNKQLKSSMKTIDTLPHNNKVVFTTEETVYYTLSSQEKPQIPNPTSQITNRPSPHFR